MDETRTVTIGEVGAAFETLLEVVGRECDSKTTQAIYWAKVDVLAILSGEWEQPVDWRATPVESAAVDGEVGL